MNDPDIEKLLGDMVRNLARRLGLDCDLSDVEETVGAIQEADPASRSLLTDFMGAWFDWWQFVDKIKRAGKQGYMDAEERTEHARLVTRRNETRERLRSHLGEKGV